MVVMLKSSYTCYACGRYELCQIIICWIWTALILCLASLSSYFLWPRSTYKYQVKFSPTVLQSWLKYTYCSSGLKYTYCMHYSILSLQERVVRDLTYLGYTLAADFHAEPTPDCVPTCHREWDHNFEKICTKSFGFSHSSSASCSELSFGTYLKNLFQSKECVCCQCYET